MMHVKRMCGLQAVAAAGRGGGARGAGPQGGRAGGGAGQRGRPVQAHGGAGDRGRGGVLAGRGRARAGPGRRCRRRRGAAHGQRRHAGAPALGLMAHRRWMVSTAGACDGTLECVLAAAVVQAGERVCCCAVPRTASALSWRWHGQPGSILTLGLTSLNRLTLWLLSALQSIQVVESHLGVRSLGLIGIPWEHTYVTFSLRDDQAPSCA